MAEETKTKINLKIALAGEADASRRYLAYGVRALQEGYPEIAQLFFETAGAETVHAYSHLLALDAIGTTAENLSRAAQGETGEIERMYPRMIAEAEGEGAHQAAASFRLAFEREKHHQQMFRTALTLFQERLARSEGDGVPTRTTAGAPAAESVPHKATGHPDGHPDGHPEDKEQNTPPEPPGPPSDLSPDTLAASVRRGSRDTQSAALRAGLGSPPSSGVTVDRRAAKRGLQEMAGEAQRIARLAGIREVVFGGQDGLISTTTLVAGVAAATSQSLVVLGAGAIAALAGALSMAVGSYLASQAQRQVYEAELASEQREIRQRPGEETAELLAALMGHGMSRRDAIEVMRRVSAHPQLMLDLLGVFELGLAPQGLGSPLRDAMLMGVAFIFSSAIPLLPFFVLGVQTGLIAAMLLALGALFALGAVKARFSGRPMLASGLQVTLLGAASGGLGYVLGRLVSALLGIHI